MSKRLLYTTEQWAKIVVVREKGYTIREIAGKLEVNKSGVEKFPKGYETKSDLAQKLRTGRPSVTTEREDRHLKRLSLENRFSTSSQLQQNIENITSFLPSVSTINRRLNEVGLKCYKPRRKPLITQVQKVKKLK